MMKSAISSNSTTFEIYEMAEDARLLIQTTVFCTKVQARMKEEDITRQLPG
jgi:hypothetical protein